MQQQQMLVAIAIVQLVVAVVCGQNDVGHFTIVGSRHIRPNSDFHIALTLHSTHTPATVRLTVRSANGSSLDLTNDTLVHPHATELVSFRIGDLPTSADENDSYQLIAEGLSPHLRFRNQTTLYAVPKRRTVLVQTDRALYNAGDLVRLRVLVLDANTRPLTVSNALHIDIEDSASNRIRRWSNQTAVDGLFGAELRLSAEPVLGRWKIVVDVLGEKSEGHFDVAEYVRPKFEVHIETDRDVVYGQERIRATVFGRYAHGEPVRGEVTVTLQPRIRGAYQPLIGDLIARKVAKVSKVAKGQVEFDVRTDLRLTEEYERELVMDVLFEEEHTGRKQSAQRTIWIRRSQFRIDVIDTSSMAAVAEQRMTYVDGEAFAIELQVSRYDGQKVAEQSGPIELSFSVDTPEGEGKTETMKLDKEGRVRATWQFPVNRTGVYLKAMFAGVTEGIGYAFPRDRKVRGLAVSVLTKKAIVGKTITVEVQSETPLESYTYAIFGRGDILVTETVNDLKDMRHEFKFTASIAMVPEAQIIVYRIVQGRMQSASETLMMRNGLQNSIDLTASSSDTTPGQSIDLKVRSRPNSIVALMAVDENARRLQTGNDLSANEIYDELMEYANKHENWNPVDQAAYGKYSVKFEHIGAFVLSNVEDPFPVKANRIAPITLSETQNYANDVLTSKKADIGPAHVFRTNTKPPRAGPYAFSRVPEPKWKRRRALLDAPVMGTWLFDEVRTGSDGFYTFHKQVPDNLTTWSITAFSLDPVTGIALTELPAQLRVQRKFSVAFDLPYALKLGEIVAVPVVVANNQQSPIVAEVTMHNEQQDLDFIGADYVADAAPKIELYRRQRATIAANDVATLTFIIRPRRLGTLPIKVTASTPLSASATAERQLPVEPEGVTIFASETQLVDRRTTPSAGGATALNFTVRLPDNAVADATRIEMRLSDAAGSLGFAQLAGIDQLLRRPHGSGEQNTVAIAVACLALRSLPSTAANEPARRRHIGSLALAYQRQLSFRHPADGSFSAFGPTDDAAGSTWLTAMAAGWLSEAAAVAPEYVDERIAAAAWRFVVAQQQADGGFAENSESLPVHVAAQSAPVAVTAHVLASLVSADRQSPAVLAHRNAINRALDFVVRSVDQVVGADGDVYAHAVLAYALQLAGHNARDYVLRTLDARATTHRNGSVTTMFWRRAAPASDAASVWYERTNSMDTEVTAYGLLAHAAAGDRAAVVAIGRWLLVQRNARGGFESSQDTLTGVQAMERLADALGGSDGAAGGGDVRLGVRYANATQRSVALGRGGGAAEQRIALPATVRAVNVTAEGGGVALVQLWWQYNTNVTGAWPRFAVDPQVNRNSNADYLHLTVCTSFVPDDRSNNSNMAVMRVELPSGFTADLETIPSLEATEQVRRVDTERGDTAIVIYFQSLGAKELCPTVNAFRTQRVAEQRPVAVTVFDYYDTTRKARMFYRLRRRDASTVCDICAAPDCPEACSARTAKRRANDADDDEETAASVNQISGARSANEATGLMIVVAVVTASVTLWN